LRALALAIVLVAQSGCESPAEETGVHVAVAANFQAAHRELAEHFSAKTGIRIEQSIGASGQLYAQIIHGAPYHLFLSADADRPAALEAAGEAVAGTRFTYALGALVLVAHDDLSLADGLEILRTGRYQHLAIANPETAPYGAAALEVIEHLGISDALAGKIVQAESVAQAYQFVISGGAELGLVAESCVTGLPPTRFTNLPDAMYSPIRQDAILLHPGADHEGARAYHAFLRSPEARAIIAAAGYRLPE
jgi:molybdate transport system substrate-binding protein